MRTLVYWCCTQEEDDRCYNIRAKTRKEALEQRERLTHFKWSKPFKVIVEYEDAFDLMRKCMSEESVCEIALRSEKEGML